MGGTTDNHWGIKSLEDWQSGLRFFLETAQELGNNQEQFHVEKTQQFGKYCLDFQQRHGVSELARSIHGVLGDHITVQQAVGLLDALRGPSSNPFPPQHVAPLLADLRIEWNGMSGEDLGELLTSLLLFAKAQGSPEQVGRSLSQVFQRANYVPAPDLIAAAVRYLWDEGFAWGRVPGALLSHLLDDRWKLSYFPKLICSLVQSCLDSEELDLLDFDSLDAAEQDAHNPAVRIGLLLDESGLPAGCELALCANIIRAFLANFGAANRANGSESGPNVHPPRADIFIGRVLQQLSFATDPESTPAEEGTNNNSSPAGKSWRVSAAIGLACSLCTGPVNREEYDWRLDRKQHAYCVGEILRCLRQGWAENDTQMLVQALRIPGPGMVGTSGVPNRIIAEVCEGLGAHWDLVITTGDENMMS